ncbi:MAG: phosphoribosyltransferase family protein, partial [Thermoanaerobaculia bacterium]
GRALVPLLDEYRGRQDVIVLALVRGGVPVGLEVSRALEVPFDLILKRVLLLPNGTDGSPVALVSVAGQRVQPADVVAGAARGREPIDFFFASSLEGFSADEEACRGERPPRGLTGKTVIIVDNGIRTGKTMSIAVGAVRKFDVCRVVVAVPVAEAALRGMDFGGADEVVCVSWLDDFGNVGVWFQKFDVPLISQIGPMLAEVS